MSKPTLRTEKMLPANWWHTDGERIACDLCPNGCLIRDGGHGRCIVRQNHGGHFYLASGFGTTGFAVDPIDKKPFNHFLPGTPVLSFGTIGCNLHCKFCQNWNTTRAKDLAIHGDWATPAEIIATAKTYGCRSIALTYNEPIIWAEFGIEVAKAAHAADLKVVAVTAGYINPEPRTEFFKHIDAANVDLKSIDPDFYRNLTGGNLEPVLDTLRWLKHQTNIWLEVTNLLIPDSNDSEESVEKLCTWVLENLGPEVPLHFSSFHPDYKLKDKPRTPRDTLIRARQQALSLGLDFPYVGNVLDQANQSTYCPQCGTCIIARDHYEISAYAITGGVCRQCGQKIPGHFEDSPGSWGRKRVAVSIHANEANMEKTPTDEQSQSTSPEEHLTDVATHSVREASSALRQLEKQANPEHPTNATSNVTADPRIDFTNSDIQLILDHTRTLIQSVISKQRAPMLLSPELAASPTYGVFVTLRRGSILRACRGSWGDPHANTLAAILTSAAVSTAMTDARFPAIVPAELPLLTLEISLMHSPQPISAQGSSIVDQIKLGQHGLVLTHPQGRALFLPQVAIEQNWDTKTFLDRLARKAGLSEDAWADPKAKLMTFEARVLTQVPQQQELDLLKLDQSALLQALQVANAIAAQHQGQVQVQKFFTQANPGMTAIYLENAKGKHAIAVAQSVNLIELIKRGVTTLTTQCDQQKQAVGAIIRCDILGQPIPLVPTDYPNRHITLQHAAILADKQGKRTMIIPDRPNIPPDKVGAALMALSITPEEWLQGQATLLAFTVRSARLSPKTTIKDQEGMRAPAVAGSFYPAEPELLKAELTRYFEELEPQETKPVRAVLLPHAGWRFCGDIIAKTLQQIEVPDEVILIGPKHTRPGARWSVAGHNYWQLPHCQIPLQTDLAKTLCDNIEGLELNDEAHQQEHCLETLLPFLHYCNPNIRIVPILLGMAEYNEIRTLARALAGVINKQEQKPLIVVSSDLNHYAPEQLNRELDQEALAALTTGKPKKLFDTCRKKNISMCGMLPAVTTLETLIYLKPKPKLSIVDYNTSGRITGDQGKGVVGYAGVLFS